MSDTSQVTECDVCNMTFKTDRAYLVHCGTMLHTQKLAISSGALDVSKPGSKQPAVSAVVSQPSEVQPVNQKPTTPQSTKQQPAPQQSASQKQAVLPQTNDPATSTKKEKVKAKQAQYYQARVGMSDNTNRTIQMYNCTLCDVQCTGYACFDSHCAGKLHCKKYLVTQNEMGFPDFYAKYGNLPYAKNSENNPTPTNIGDYMLHAHRSGLFNKLHCRACGSRQFTISAWCDHVLSNEHAEKMIKFLEELGGATFMSRYGDLPGPNPEMLGEDLHAVSTRGSVEFTTPQNPAFFGDQDWRTGQIPNYRVPPPTSSAARPVVSGVAQKRQFSNVSNDSSQYTRPAKSVWQTGNMSNSMSQPYTTPTSVTWPRASNVQAPGLTFASRGANITNFSPRGGNFRGSWSNVGPAVRNFGPRGANVGIASGNFAQTAGNVGASTGLQGVTFRPRVGNFAPGVVNMRPRGGIFGARGPSIGNFRPVAVNSGLRGGTGNIRTIFPILGGSVAGWNSNVGTTAGTTTYTAAGTYDPTTQFGTYAQFGTYDSGTEFATDTSNLYDTGTETGEDASNQYGYNEQFAGYDSVNQSAGDGSEQYTDYGSTDMSGGTYGFGDQSGVYGSTDQSGAYGSADQFSGDGSTDQAGDYGSTDQLAGYGSGYEYSSGILYSTDYSQANVTQTPGVQRFSGYGNNAYNSNTSVTAVRGKQPRQNSRHTAPAAMSVTSVLINNRGSYC